MKVALDIGALVGEPAEDAGWLDRRAAAFPRALALAGGAVLLQVALAVLVPNAWYRMLVAGVILSAAALAFVDVGWRDLYRPRPRHLVQGAAATLGLYVIGAVVARVSSSVPVLASQVADVYGWAAAVPERLAVPLLVLIVAAEEIVWRNAVTLPLAARLGACKGVVAAALLFAIAHLPLGVPLLTFAALGAGGFWSAMVVKTRSAVPALVCHLLWDLAVLFWWPFERT